MKRLCKRDEDGNGTVTDLQKSQRNGKQIPGRLQNVGAKVGH
jgi:hypothetical protein